MNRSTNANGGISVFLVDDDTMFLKSLEHHLHLKLKEKINLKTFSTAETCMKNLEQKPDIIVLDYFLNRTDQHAMNGVQALEKIKHTHPDINVIMLSGQDNMQIAIDSMKYGAFEYVVKNENALMKMHNTIRNSMKAIKMAEQLKFYKWFVAILISIIAIIAITAIIHTI